MSDIQLTHSPNQCCECVPELEKMLSAKERELLASKAELAKASQELAKMRKALEKIALVKVTFEEDLPDLMRTFALSALAAEMEKKSNE